MFQTNNQTRNGIEPSLLAHLSQAKKRGIGAEYRHQAAHVTTLTILQGGGPPAKLVYIYIYMYG